MEITLAQKAPSTPPNGLISRARSARYCCQRQMRDGDWRGGFVGHLTRPRCTDNVEELVPRRKQREACGVDESCSSKQTVSERTWVIQQMNHGAHHRGDWIKLWLRVDVAGVLDEKSAGSKKEVGNSQGEIRVESPIRFHAKRIVKSVNCPRHKPGFRE